MSELLIQKEDLVELADKIRAFAQTTEKMTLEDMKITLNEMGTNLTEAIEQQNILIEQLTSKATAVPTYYDDDQLEDAYVMRTATNITAYGSEAIDSYAFQAYTGLKQANFPETSAISSWAFLLCGIASASFPKAKTIGSHAFQGCGYLTDINFQEATAIEPYAFGLCIRLKDVNFPNVISIYSGAFSSCYDLETVDFPKATTVATDCFYSCIWVKKMKFGAFSGEATAFGSSPNLEEIIFPAATSAYFPYQPGLTSVSLPNATTLRSEAFRGCSSLSTIDLPKVSSIGSAAFSGCSNLVNVNIPLVSIINTSTFQKCISLSNIDWPQITYISSYAFYSCTNLTTASFINVSSIGSDAFKGCHNLISLTLGGSSVCSMYKYAYPFESTPIAGYSAVAGRYGSIYVPASLLTAYQTNSVWSAYSDRFVGY